MKFLKIKKGKLLKFNNKSNSLKFGLLGLKACESGFLNLKQVGSIKQFIFKKTNRKVKIWLRVYNYLPITSKPVGTRMGKGKGKISYWVSKIKPGNIIIEIYGSNFKKLFFILKSIKNKLPIKTNIFF